MPHAWAPPSRKQRPFPGLRVLTWLPRLRLRQQELGDRLQVAGNEDKLLQRMEGSHVLRVGGDTHVHRRVYQLGVLASSACCPSAPWVSGLCKSVGAAWPCTSVCPQRLAHSSYSLNASAITPPALSQVMPCTLLLLKPLVFDFCVGQSCLPTRP